MEVRVTQEPSRTRVELLLSEADVENIRDGLDDLLRSTGSFPAYWSESSDGSFVVLHRLDRPGTEPNDGTAPG